MAKGKSFERLVGLIREALKDRSSTKVLLNQKVESKTGRKRQFDVIVETVADGFIFRTAIECKEHGRRIEAKEIEAFYCKCELMSGINKKVFVSNSSFQEGAIVSAKALDIELHILDKVTGEQMSSWINAYEVYQLSFSPSVTKVKLTLEGEEKDRPEHLSHDDAVFYTDGQTSTYQDFIVWLANDPNLKKKILNYMMIIVAENDSESFFTEETQLEFSRELPTYAFIKSKGKDLFVHAVTIQLAVSTHKRRALPETRIMQNISENRQSAGVVTLRNFVDSDKNLEMVFTPESGNFKTFITASDGIIIGELETSAIFDPKTKKWEFLKRDKKQLSP